MRISEKKLAKMVDQLNQLENRPRAASHQEPGSKYAASIGHLKIDNAACYGGYRIAEIGEYGSESFYHPYNSERITAREMYQYLLGRLHNS